MSTRPRFAVLVSGTGTNLQAIIDAIGAGRLQAELALVLSNKANAPALERATRANVPTRVLAPRDFVSRDAYDDALADAVAAADVDWLVLAGFLRVLSGAFVRRFAGRIVNIHPSLLPAFPGLDGPGQALAHGVKVAGCTVHLVDEGVDSGPIIAQRAVPVLADDDRDTLAARILEQEHQVLVDVLVAISEQRLRVEPDGAGRPRALLVAPSAP